MRSANSLLRVPAAFIFSLAAGCTTGMFTRDTVTLEGAQLDDYSIRYEPMRDCILKQMLPSRYSVKRANYRLELTIKPGYDEEPPRIDAQVSGSADLQLEFPGLKHPPDTGRTDDGRRYTINVTDLTDQKLVIDVRGGGALLGQEQLSVRAQRCHGLGFRGA